MTLKFCEFFVQVVDNVFNRHLLFQVLYYNVFYCSGTLVAVMELK